MKILVTGGSGLVGRAIYNLMDADENKWMKTTIFLSSKDCDLLDFEATNICFQTHKPDIIIHLAACVGGLFKNMNDKVGMFEKNIIINMNVLRAAHKNNVQSVVSCLSTCIFPDKTTYPINEAMLHNGPPHTSNSGYAWAKRMLEVQSRLYREQFGRNYSCIIPTNIYGPHDNFSLEDGHVIPALIHRCYLAKQRGERFIVKGSGSPMRQFIYSLDLAKCILRVAENYDEIDPIILSVSEKDEVSIAHVALAIAKKFNYTNMLEFDKTCSDGQFKKTADNSKMADLYPDLIEFTDIHQGINKTIDWFIDNYENCRK